LMIGLLIGMGILILCAEDETLEELAERRAIRRMADRDRKKALRGRARRRWSAPSSTDSGTTQRMNCFRCRMT